MADRDLQIRAGRGIHPDPEIGGVGAVLKNIFRPLGSQFGSNVRGWGGGASPGPSPGSATAQEPIIGTAVR